MKFNKIIILLFCVIIVSIITYTIFQNKGSNFLVGQKIDSFNNVSVYYNGSVSNIKGRNLTKDGYNLGLKYQCVEFVKRYYYEHLNHKMPNSFGHAKDFFNPKIKDGKINKDRNLLQYHNSSHSKPKVNDLLIFKGNAFNKYGHVAIVSKVENNQIEIIQQNGGPFSTTRKKYRLSNQNQKWKIENNQIVGWLRK